MQYHAENQLEDFEFHDAYFSLIHMNNTEFVVSAKCVNIHKNTIQNPSPYDMEVNCAKISFTGFSVLTYESGGGLIKDINGISHTEKPIVLKEKKAQNQFWGELKNPIWVKYFGMDDDTQYCLEACGTSPYFSVTFKADKVSIAWDEYSKKAWYELHKQYISDIVLDTSNGAQHTKIYINCNEEWNPPKITISMKYNGKEYYGCADDYLWVSAFANLQKQLPLNVVLKCCLTCRHGNMCPVGNQPNQLFCTKDVCITQKSDLFFYTEDETECAKRAKKYTDICDSYQPQNNEDYTYNDYLYLLTHDGEIENV